MFFAALREFLDALHEISGLVVGDFQSAWIVMAEEIDEITLPKDFTDFAANDALFIWFEFNQFVADFIVNARDEEVPRGVIAIKTVSYFYFDLRRCSFQEVF